MIIPKYVMGLAGLLLLGTLSQAQNPSQADILKYIKSKTMILYMADTKRPDSIKEIKPASIESASGNVIFGKTNNSSMDISAAFLRELLTVKNGDIQFQQMVYDLLQKSAFPIVLFFMNDVAVSTDQEFLRQNKIWHYPVGNRYYIWAGSYLGPDLIPKIGKRWAFVYGEYFNKDIMLMKEGFIDLFTNVNRGNFGQASQSIFHSRDAAISIEKSDKDIPKMTSAQQALWIRADMKQLGIIGNDWNGRDEIGTAPVQRQVVYRGINVGPNVLNFWYPNVRPSDNGKAWKQTLIGKLKSEAEHFNQDNWFPDHDIDFYIIPDPPYEYLIKENPKPNVNLYSGLGNLINDHAIPNCPSVHDHVEAEIDLKNENEKQFLHFFNDQMKTAGSAGFYGAWIYDRGHCDHPEIHPAEQIWWSHRSENVSTYRCNLVCDYSERYMLASQFDGDGGKYSIMKPWAAPPVTGVFAIAFTLKPTQDRLVYRIFHHDYHNLNVNKTVTFDKAKVHHYVLNGKKVITVVESELECVKISFDQVAFDNAGNLTGFIVLTSAVGQSPYPEQGHLFFEVKKSLVKGASSPPGKFKISLESIECTAVGDGDDAEEIFGSITCKAFSVKDTASYRSQTLPVKANTATNLCKGNLETLFCSTCPNWISFKKNHKNTFTTSFTYDFPADGYFEVTGDLDEADSNNCRDTEFLGQTQKTYVLTNEIGSTPYRFTQFFASGATIMKANYSIQRVR